MAKRHGIIAFNTMSIGIVIPAYNAEGFLAETLDSVLAQTEPDFEAIVVDDGSPDGTAALAQGYAARDRRLRVIRQANGGTARARNAGAAALSREVSLVAFLDHDDVWTADALAILRSAVESNPGAVAAHGLARKVDALGKATGEDVAAIQHNDRRMLVDGRVVKAARAEPTTAAMVVYDNLICTPGVVLIRRTALDQLTISRTHPGSFLSAPPETGGVGVSEGTAERVGCLFDPDYAPLDDWNFWLRLTRIGDIAFIDRVVLNWRRHEAAGSTDIAAMSAAELRIRERLIAAELPIELRQVAEDRYRKLLATRQRRSAQGHWKSARAHFGAGRVGAGASAWANGMRAYFRYLSLPPPGSA
jgi:glycosyltransferase involved in cell wall biosynthesis